jgi:glycerol-1-phosphate dehydrogenase [NAD(P)+]
VQNNLQHWLSGPELLAIRDFGAIARLFSGLIVVGLAMEFYGSSRPASGADHQIAHLWEMEGLQHEGRKVSHGACVSIGCRTALALYDWLVEQDLTTLDIDAVADAAPDLPAKFAEIDRGFEDGRIASRAKIQTEAKHIGKAELHERLRAVVGGWPAMRDRLKTHLIRMQTMESMLRRAGAPVSAGEIGVTPTHHKATVYASRFIRSRYTILDLLDETGLLGPAVEAVFAQPSFRAT